MMLEVNIQMEDTFSIIPKQQIIHFQHTFSLKKAQRKASSYLRKSRTVLKERLPYKDAASDTEKEKRRSFKDGKQLRFQ